MSRRAGLTLFLAGAVAACGGDAVAPAEPSAQVAIQAAAVTAENARTDAERHPRCERPPLTEEQIQQIRALQQAFWEAVADDIRLIHAVVKEAREAYAAGASREEIAAILARADEAKANVRQARIRLQEAIAEILTPDQRRRHCVPVPPSLP